MTTTDVLAADVIPGDLITVDLGAPLPRTIATVSVVGKAFGTDRPIYRFTFVEQRTIKALEVPGDRMMQVKRSDA